MAKDKIKSIDLGELQTSFLAAKGDLQNDTVALAKAQENFRKSRNAYNAALDELQDSVNLLINS